VEEGTFRARAAFKAGIFFAQPCSSWERGLNENASGLARRYIPKGRKFDTVTDEKINFIMHRLNH